MDTENPHGTITGLLVQRTSQPNSDPSENERKLMILLKLGSHFWTPDFTPAQAKHLLADYIEDLQKYRAPELVTFAHEWRTNPKNTKFPRVGDVIAGLERNRADVTARAEFRPISATRPLMWWHRPKDRWYADWSEDDVPHGEKICDIAGGELRYPQ